MQFYPTTVEIAVPRGMLAAAGVIDGVAVIEHDETYNEYRDAEGTTLARVVFPV
jgi:hypothetical protein